MKSIEQGYVDVEATEVKSNTYENDKSNNQGLFSNGWKKLTKVCIGASLIALMGCAAFWGNKYINEIQSPQYALETINKAIVSRNTKTLQKLVDLDNISKTVRNETMYNPIYYCKPERIRCENLFIQKYPENEDIKSIKECVLNKINGQNNIEDRNSRANVLSQYLDTKYFEYVEYRELTKPTDKHKILGLLLQNKRLNEDFILQVKMEQVPWQSSDSIVDKMAVFLKLKQWRITDIADMGSFIRKLKESEKNKLFELQEKTREELKTSIVATDVTTRLDSEGLFVKDRSITYEGNFKNNTSKNIKKVQGYFLISGVGGSNTCKYTHDIEKLAVNDTALFVEKYSLDNAPDGVLYKKDLTQYYTIPKENRNGIFGKIKGWASDIMGKYQETTEKAYHINYATAYVVDQIEFEDGSVLKVPDELPEI